MVGYLTGRQYAGVTLDPAIRQQQHAADPPSRMAADAAKFSPFGVFFQFELVGHHSSRAAAEGHERQLIKQLRLTGPAGYNILPAAPGHSRQFYAMQKQRQLKAWRSKWYGR
eukprot:GHUV01016502.1.p2 GENE.GHUV01016502.1~~GHUV01016502.1.p2  ORF type:complete len:112 (+),score=34.67 GHUV01016502.1:523-858(+)